MIISDLNYLETVSKTDNLLGGKTLLFFSPITQINANATLQSAEAGFFGYASNKNYTDQSNSVKF